MKGIQTASIALARNLWDYVREDLPHVTQIITGKIPADDVYIAKRIDEIHLMIINANRIELDSLMARYRGDV